jgi:hypothetical protein
MRSSALIIVQELYRRPRSLTKNFSNLQRIHRDFGHSVCVNGTAIFDCWVSMTLESFELGGLVEKQTCQM